MTSNYSEAIDAADVRVFAAGGMDITDLIDDWDEEPDWVVEPETRKCNICHGSGLVEVHGQETDCINCEGMGDVEI